MNDPFEILKLANRKLMAFKGENYAFKAWIIYSTIQQCFVAGINVYKDNGTWIITAYLSSSPLHAIVKVDQYITDWNGQIIPREQAPFIVESEVKGFDDYTF